MADTSAANRPAPTGGHGTAPIEDLTAGHLAPSGPLLAYSADVRRHVVLIRGGDSRFDNVTDARLRVTRPR